MPCWLVQGTRKSGEVVIITVHDLGCDRKLYSRYVSVVTVGYRVTKSFNKSQIIRMLVYDFC